MGRKLVLVLSSAITPVGIIALTMFGYNLYFIYGIIFFIGLTYNTRSSTAYVFGTEFMMTRDHLSFGKYNFVFSGIF